MLFLSANRTKYTSYKYGYVVEVKITAIPEIWMESKGVSGIEEDVL